MLDFIRYSLIVIIVFLILGGATMLAYMVDDIKRILDDDK